MARNGSYFTSSLRQEAVRDYRNRSTVARWIKKKEALDLQFFVLRYQGVAYQ
jgi:hypothetical protein